MDYPSSRSARVKPGACESSQPTPIMGFDAAGEVFEVDNRLFRGIYRGRGGLYREVLEVCKQNDLFAAGIIRTHESEDSFASHVAYELLLEHEKIPFISYPHEWSASMLKAAAALHVQLYLELGGCGLTLKDWHPYNILFRGAEPVFVDFCSVIPLAELASEDYLTPPLVPAPFDRFWDTTSKYVYEMYRRMCVPYFLLPLFGMANQEHARMRRRLFATTMNAANEVMRPNEVLPEEGWKRWRFQWQERLKRIALVDPRPTKSLFFELLAHEIGALDVEPRPSGYIGYYAAKGEAFDFEQSEVWTRKQSIIHDLIRDERPRTLLDVGSNTGWFSVLAAKMGCKVVAVDIDESCSDHLYLSAKGRSLPILPLVMDISDPTPSLWPAREFKSLPQWLMRSESPVLLPAQQRLACDVVLALAIVHHLVLGIGKSFDEVTGLLSAFTRETLAVEFVALQDKLIAANQSFFPAYNANPAEMQWYTLGNFVDALSKYFKTVKVHHSHPQSRSIIICRR